jgi:hypothetical protein
MFDKTFSNLEEIKARKGPIIAITTEDKAADLARKAEDVIALPPTLEPLFPLLAVTLEPLFPLLAVIPLQLLAYHIAVARGCDVDKPRNLAKSVTVEYSGEQRFGGVTVQLIAGPCDEPGTLLETVLTGSDGVAVFAVPPAGDAALCARITQGRPTGTVPFHLPGVVVPRGSGQPVPAPVVPNLTEPPLEVADSISVREDSFSLIFRSTTGRSYTVERTGDLDSWSNVTNAATYDFGYSQRVVIPLYTNAVQSFFRVVERP